MFTYNIQLAGYDYNQYDEKGVVDYEEFINVLLQFSWLEQVKLYDDLRAGCSATLSVTNTITNESLWVSVKGNVDEYNFLIGYVYLKNVKSFLGLGKEKTKQWVDIYEVDKVDDIALQFYKYFFKNNIESLTMNLQLEKKFDSMQTLMQ
jgi:hypothetical protein